MVSMIWPCHALDAEKRLLRTEEDSEEVAKELHHPLMTAATRKAFLESPANTLFSFSSFPDQASSQLIFKNQDTSILFFERCTNSPHFFFFFGQFFRCFQSTATHTHWHKINKLIPFHSFRINYSFTSLSPPPFFFFLNITFTHYVFTIPYHHSPTNRFSLH